MSRRFNRCQRFGRLAAITVGLVCCLTAKLTAACSESDVAFPGRVIDLGSRKPIVGAVITVTERQVTRHCAPAVTKEFKTDSDGRFTINLRRDAAGEPRRTIVVRVGQPDYIARETQPISVSRLILTADQGEKSRFESIPLEPGVLYSARIVDPGNRPVEGAKVELSCRDDNNPSADFSDDSTGKSDAMGFVRIRMPKCRSASMAIKTAEFATFQHSWNEEEEEEGVQSPYVPSDLGTFVLERGVAMTGRVVSVDGKPIGRYGVEVISMTTGDRVEARADDSGSFTFAHLSPDSYLVGSLGQGGEDENASGPETTRPVRPKCISVTDSPVSDFVLTEIPTVTIKAHFVDSAGRPTTGWKVTVVGQLPPEKRKIAAFRLRRLIKAIVGGEDEPADDEWPAQNWTVRAEPDASGRVAIAVPKDLTDAAISAADESSQTAFKIRMKANGAVADRENGSVDLADASALDVEFISYRAPSLILNIKTDEGDTPRDDIGITAYAISDGEHNDVGHFEQARPGVYHGSGLLPDKPFMVQVTPVSTYVAVRVEGITIPEGGAISKTVILSKKPKPADVGDPAPPLLLSSLDGKPRSLADYQGRFVLIAMWSAQSGSDDIPKLKAIQDKYGADKRFAMLGLSCDIDVKVMEEAIRENKLDWPQVRLGEAYDWIAAAYGWDQVPSAILIGPTGLILAKELSGDDIEKAIADHLK